MLINAQPPEADDADGSASSPDQPAPPDAPSDQPQTPSYTPSAPMAPRSNISFVRGLAPFTGRNLMAFGFLGGVLAAGIAGAVNYRRVGDSGSSRQLLMLTVPLAALQVVISILLNFQFSLSDPTVTQINPAVSFLSIVGGLTFGAWIYRRQFLLHQAWQTLSGKERPSGKEQGGCLTAFGWLFLSGMIGVTVSTVIIPTVQPLFSVFFPSQRLQADGLAWTIPSGWGRVNPESMGVGCSLTECLGVILEASTDTFAFVQFQRDLVPLDFTMNFLRAQLERQSPDLRNGESSSFTPPGMVGIESRWYSAASDEIVLIVQLMQSEDVTAIGMMFCPIDVGRSRCEIKAAQVFGGLVFGDFNS